MKRAILVVFAAFAVAVLIFALAATDACALDNCPPFESAPGECRTDACSDDPWGVLNNQCFLWPFVAGADQYKVCTEDDALCVMRPEQFYVPGTVLMSRNDWAVLTVRACDCHNPDLPCACSEPSVVRTGFLPYACIKSLPAVPDGRKGTTNPACEFPCSDDYYTKYRLTGHVPPCS